MSATDELRRMLDERGVKWESDDCPSFDGKVVYRYTYWGEGKGATFCEPIGAQPGTLGAMCDFSAIGVTPEQAIATTLGAGTCKNLANHQGCTEFVCSECGAHYLGFRFSFCPHCGARIEVER